jgi:hypothetical protein
MISEQDGIFFVDHREFNKIFDYVEIGHYY